MPYVIASGVVYVLALLVAVTGGVRTEIWHVRVSVQWPTVLSVLAWCSLMIGVRRAGAHAGIRDVGQRLPAFISRHSSGIALAVALCTVATAFAFGALVAAGADAYGYVSQGLLWAQGNPVQLQGALALQAPWPNAPRSFTPLGYVPGRAIALVVPVYAPGLPLQMAALARLGGLAGTFAAVPILGGIAVWATYRLGRRIAERAAPALVSACLVACSPTFLYQLMQPMSDVPVTAWWILAILTALDRTMIGALGSGLYGTLAVATRPNLIVLALPVAAYVAFAPGAEPRTDEPEPRTPNLEPRTVIHLALFGLGLAPGIVLVAAANSIFYGSPFLSGYGPPSAIYDLRNVPTNVVHYVQWLYSTHSLLVFVGFGLPFAARAVSSMSGSRQGLLARHGLLGGAFTLALVGAYALYIPFDHWGYLRFLLPAIPILLILAVTTVDVVAARFGVRGQALAAIAMVLPLYYVSFALHGDAFALKRLFRDRYEAAGAAIAARTTPSAAIIGVLQSGSARLYGNRLTVRYDVIPSEWLDRAAAYLEQHGHPPYIALESTEHNDFAARFARLNQSIAGVPAVPVDPLQLVTLYGPLSSRSRP